MPSVLRNRHLWILAVAESVSGIGNWVTMVALFALVVFQEQGGVQESSLLILSGLLPMLICSPLAGWLADRVNRKGLMLAAQLTSALVVVGLILSRRLESIYLLVALHGAISSLMQPARQAALPDLLSAHQLTRANALLQQLAGLIKVGAPVLAGAVIALAGPQQAMVLDVISYLISAAILLRLPSLPPSGGPFRSEPSVRPGAESPAQSPVRAVHAQPAAPAGAGSGGPATVGWARILREARWLRLIYVTGFLATFLVIAFDVTSPVITRDLLAGGEGLFGLLIGLVGLGSVAGSTALLLRKGNGNLGRETALGLWLLAAIPATLALGSWLGHPGVARWLVALGCLAGGLGSGVVMVQTTTLIQTQAPPAWRGRISGGLQGMLVAGQVAGVVVTPLVVPGIVPVATYFALSALAMMLLALGVRRTATGTGVWPGRSRGPGAEPPVASATQAAPGDAAF